MVKSAWYDAPVLDDWQKELFDYVRTHRRPPSLQEQRWLRLRHDMCNARGEQTEYALAAAVGNVGDAMRRENAETTIRMLSTDDGGCRVTMTVKPAGVIFKIVDAAGHAVPDSEILFPDTDIRRKSDKYGIATLDRTSYEEYIKTRMGLQCVLNDGVVRNLMID